ncbi:MAG: LAGLIDADG family homing endonuclease [Patescibacteria group bacterium]|nr:LAGLIDADG family homing endonuclease [Patescibacteria group bacterium]
MKSSWNKGKTKYTHPSVLKISNTLKVKKIDNFFKWREKAKKNGLIRSHYPELERNGDLAELIGMVLGDGYLGALQRTEVLRISLNSNNQGLIKRVAFLVESVFYRKSHVGKKSHSNCTTVTIYEKFISKRLQIPVGPKKGIVFKIPGWVLPREDYKIRFLRGLYEAEGSYCVHAPTYTYKFFFKNCNKSLLRIVYFLLRGLGFHPHKGENVVQISRKAEVEAIINLLKFRKY